MEEWTPGVSIYLHVNYDAVRIKAIVWWAYKCDSRKLKHAKKEWCEVKGECKIMTAYKIFLQKSTSKMFDLYVQCKVVRRV